MLKDLTTEPVGIGTDGPVYLKDLWPTSHEIAAVMSFAKDPAIYRSLYGDVANANPAVEERSPARPGRSTTGPRSTYIAKPPFFDGFKMATGRIGDIKGARALGIFGDSVTTDHISPAGSIKPTSPAGVYLLEHDVSVVDFNSYGSRRGNHDVMMRGTFANVRIKNLMLPLKADGTREEGGVTLFQPSGERMPIYDAAMKYIAQGTPTIVFGGEEYGTGSSRDWAAKGTQLLGVKVVVAKSFERIHRSNLVGMGVLPCQFKGSDTVASLGIKGDEMFDLTGIEAGIKPQMDVTLTIHRKDGTAQKRAGAAAHRHADRSRLLPPRRHPAVRAAGADGGGVAARVALPQACGAAGLQYLGSSRDSMPERPGPFVRHSSTMSLSAARVSGRTGVEAARDSRALHDGHGARRPAPRSSTNVG